MAKEAGIGGLGTGGWAIVAGVGLSAGLAALYALGVIGPRPADAPVAVVPAPAVEVAKPAGQPEKPETAEAVEVKPDAGTAPAEAPETAGDEAATEPQATETAAATEETVSEQAPQAVPLAAPVLDQIFVERDGSTLISGRAEVGARIAVLLDGAEMHGFEVAGDGNFAEFLTLSFSDAARVLTLRAERDGQTVLSEDYIIAALPEPEPVAVAAAEETISDPAPAPAQSEREPAAAETAQATEQVAAAPETAAQAPAEAPAQEQTGQQEVAAGAATDPKPEAERQSAAAAPEPAPTPVAPQPAAAPQDQTGTTTTETVTAETGTPEVAEAGKAVVETEPAAQVAEAASEEKPQAPEPAKQPETAVQETVAAAQAVAEPAASTPAPVAVLRSDASGVELVQAPEVTSPLEPARVALDTIGYSETGSVRLTGRANGGSVVRVYFDNRAVSDAPADAQGKWHGEIQGIVPGVYTLRLDELGQDGAVLSRLETPFKREAPEVLRPAQAASGEAPTRPLVHAVTVQKGDTLWAISRERYGEGLLYVKVFDANRGSIRNPDLIYPGQVFTLPD